ncbi:MAG: glyoxalase [Dehalococcoidia bacterium]|nr:glyoxalase [Dehalococcoidia bacterium]
MPNYWYDHVHLISPDPIKTAEFYENMFNAKRVGARKRPDGGTSVELSLNGSRILIMSGQIQPGAASPSGASNGLEHFGIKTDNIEVAVADLKRQGVQFRDEIRQAMPSVKIAYFWAPENVLVELVEVTAPRPV